MWSSSSSSSRRNSTNGHHSPSSGGSGGRVMSGLPRSQNSSSSSSKRPSASGGQPLSPASSSASIDKFMPGLCGIAEELKAAINTASSHNPEMATVLHRQVDAFVKSAAVQMKDRCKLQEMLSDAQHQQQLSGIRQEQPSKELLNDLGVNTSSVSHAYSELSLMLHDLGGGHDGVLYVLKDTSSLSPNLKHALQVIKRVASREHVVVELV